MEDKAVEDKSDMDSNEDGNVPRDMEETSESSLDQEQVSFADITNRAGIIFSSSSRQETQSLPSSSKTDSETGETSVRSSHIWHLPRCVESSDESSEAMEVLTAETNTSVSKGKFKIPQEVISNVRPVITVSEERDASVDEVVVKNPTIQLTIDASPSTELDCWTFSKKSMSRTVSTTFEDTLPDHGVCVSEESSSSSSDVFRSISSLKLAESVGSGLTLPLVVPRVVVTPPPPATSKRRISDPDLSIEDCSGTPSKRGRISEEVSSESTQMTDEELQEKSIASVYSEAVGTETDKGPLIEFSGDFLSSAKSE